MTVAELIAQLQQFDPSLPVVGASDPEGNRDYPVIRCEISPWTAGAESGTDLYLKVGYDKTMCLPPITDVSQFGT